MSTNEGVKIMDVQAFVDSHSGLIVSPVMRVGDEIIWKISDPCGEKFAALHHSAAKQFVISTLVRWGCKSIDDLLSLVD